MPQVAVQIAGKTYRMACDEGQEAHLMELAQRFDRTIDDLRGSFGEIGDQRLTVMAGVMVTDELAERDRQIAQLRDEVERLKRDTRPAAPQPDPEREAKLAGAIATTARKIEEVAALLERRAASSG